jgi:hypothetical protein
MENNQEFEFGQAKSNLTIREQARLSLIRIDVSNNVYGFYDSLERVTVVRHIFASSTPNRRVVCLAGVL